MPDRHAATVKAARDLGLNRIISPRRGAGVSPAFSLPVETRAARPRHGGGKSQFHFRRRDDACGSVAPAPLRQLHLRRLPAGVPKRAAERRRAGDVPRGLRGSRANHDDDRGPDTAGSRRDTPDVGNAAAFAASDWARTMTAAIVNVSCGALID